VFVDLFPTYPFTSVSALGCTKRGNSVRPVRRGPHPQDPPPSDPPPADPPADPPPSDDPPADPPDRGFPPNTPIKDMNAEQQAAYWKFHDRRKSDTLSAYDGITPEQAKQYKDAADEARRNQLQPSERALEDARSEATNAALQQAASQWAPLLVEEVVGQFVTDETQRPTVLAGIDPMRFFKDGKFEKDALIGHLTGLAAAFGGAPAGAGTPPPPRQWGQSSSRPPNVTGKDEGLAEARRRGFIKD
jgi:hypothetical protein